MLNFPKLQLTNAGKLLIAEALKNIPFTFTKFQLGKGRVLSSIADVTALGNPVISASITSAVKSTGAVTLSASFDNGDVETTFNATELGLFAQQTGGSEVLYAYAYEANAPTPIPSYPTHGFMEETFYYTVAVGDATNFTVNIADALSAQRIVAGSYEGDGTQGRTISVGFTPRAVIVSPAFIDEDHADDTYGGLAVTGKNVISNAAQAAARVNYLNEWDDDFVALMVVNSGFKISVNTTNGLRTNEQGRHYSYIAFK